MVRNSRGSRVDPVPFLVVAASAFVVVYSFGPAYLLALGLPLDAALAVCTLAVATLAAGAYHRLVWTHRPSLRGVVPAGQRLQWLFYTVLTGIALLALLSLPLLA